MKIIICIHQVLHIYMHVHAHTCCMQVMSFQNITSYKFSLQMKKNFPRSYCLQTMLMGKLFLRKLVCIMLVGLRPRLDPAVKSLQDLHDTRENPQITPVCVVAYKCVYKHTTFTFPGWMNGEQHWGSTNP